MALSPGARIGIYEITAPLGAGGMGEVYRARDSRLHRDVALKILPESVATDRERLARFEREAHVLASLNHPGIAQIYGLEDFGSSCALVMELVSGRTLTDVIAAAPQGLPLDEALPIALQISEAMEAAHERGIVHRDLKPGNVMVTADDRVKVLDFGLARVVEPEAGDSSRSPTITAATHAGVILGTAGYMSPEQVKGRTADRRSDVWAFGCVLYELVTGTRAFDGVNVSEALANVLKTDPDWSRLPAGLPAAIRLCAQRCLVRDRHDRIGDFSTVRFLLTQRELIGSAAPAPATHVRLVLRERAWWVAGALLLAAAAGMVAWRVKPAPAQTTVTTRFEYLMPDGQELGQGNRRVAVSPDGKRIVYVANRQLFVRALADTEARSIPGSADDPLYPVFSPDGGSIAYVVRGQGRLKRIPVDGGTAVLLAELPNVPSDLSWKHGFVVYAEPVDVPGVYAVPDTGGTPRLLAAVDAKTESALSPTLIDPGHVLFTLRQLNVPVAAGGVSLVVQPLAGGGRVTLVPDGSAGQVLESGHLAYISGGSFRVAPYDAARRQVTGPAVALWQVANAGAGFSVSRTGTLAYTTSVGPTARQMLWVDRKGNERPLTTAPAGYFDVRMSPDGSKIALCLDGDIYVWTIGAGTLRRLTLTPGASEYNPTWTPDGRDILHDAAEGGARRILKRAADGTGSASEVVPAPGGYPDAITRDGAYLVYHQPSNRTLLQPLIPRGPSRPLLPLKGQFYNAEFSPDGKWIAYQSDESGKFEVYVHPFPAMDGGRWQISTGGGTHPLWARSGQELFFIDGAGMLTAMSVQTASGFVQGKSTALFQAGQYYFNVARNYDVTPDGSRFVFVKPTNLGRQRQSFTVVTNWFEELKARVK